MGAERVHDLVVVGGGMTGLAAAWWAAAAGRDVLLLEESDRVGGVVRTDRVGGYRVERAAASVPSTARSLPALVASLPAAPRLVPARPAARRQFLLTRSGLRVVPRTPPELLRTPLLPWGAKVRLLAEVLRGPRRGARGETLEGFVARRFGRAVAERFLVPFTRGIYGADPSRLGAGDAFPTLPALERRRGSVLKGLMARGRGAPREVLLVEGGTEALPRAIAAALGERVRLRAPVTAVVPPPDGEPAAPVALALVGGERVLAREAVLATTAPRQAALLEPFAPLAADALRTVVYAPIAVADVGLPPGHPPVPEGFGFLSARGSGSRLLGATFASRLSEDVAPPGHALVRVFLGGTEDPGVLDLDDAALASVALDGLGRALGGRLAPDLVEVRRLPRAIPLFSPGHRGRMAALQADVSRRRLRLSGSHVTGVSLDACVTPAGG